MSPLSASGDQNTGVSALASVLPNEYSELISLKMTGLISLLSKGLWVGYTTVQNRKFNLKKLIFVYQTRSGSLWESELEKDDQKVQISSYKVNKY